jgi:hypothetical protein
MSVIYDTNVTFNQPLTNVKDILLLYPTDTILDISCTRFDISGQLLYNSLVTTNSNINVNSIKLANSTNPYINIKSPLVPSYSYNITNGTAFQNTFISPFTNMVANQSFVLESDINGNNWKLYNNYYINIS